MLSRRAFLHQLGLGAAATVGCQSRHSSPSTETFAPVVTVDRSSESLVKVLFDSLNDRQRKTICFDWNYKDPQRGLLRKHICNSWRITPPAIRSDFYSLEQQTLIRDIFEGLVQPDWIERFDRQFTDDAQGFGLHQSIALIGTPGDGPFEFVMTGRHVTFRCDGNSTEHLAFGGPIVYGHAPGGTFEKPGHPGNVFWHQAIAANKVFQMMDGRQRKLALLPEAPDEAEIAFRGNQSRDGIPVSEFSRDQRESLQGVLTKLIEPFRVGDRDEVLMALQKQGGLDACHLAFYERDRLSDELIWDNWRLEGPSFVWHYRGSPHVHVWVHVADSPKVELNALNNAWPLRKE